MHDKPATTDSEAQAPEFGDFPFPLAHGKPESEYLTWLRNHSNYMAMRGFLDHLRSAAVLVRGIIVNFLTFLPYLLIVAIVLANTHHWMLAHPFFLTRAMVGLGVASILFFLVATPLFKISRYKKSLTTGSESTIKQRDLYERSFGALLLAVLAVAFFESLPWLLELLHDFKQEGTIGWQGVLAAAATALALFSGSDKLLSVLSGVKKTLAMVLIGIAGLLVPLLVILYVTDFLIYGQRPSPYVMFSPLVIPVIGVIGIIFALALGRRAFRWKEFAWVTAMLVAGILSSFFVIGYGLRTAIEAEKTFYERTDKAFIPLEQLASQFKTMSHRQELTPEVAKLVDDLISVQHDFERDTAALNSQAESYYQQLQEQPESRLKQRAKWAEWHGHYFKRAQQFVTLGDKLSKQPEENLIPLRREIGALARIALSESIGTEYDPADTLWTPDKAVANTLRRALVGLQLTDRATTEGLSAAAAVTNVIRRARDKLRPSSVEEISAFISEKELFAAVKESFAMLPGEAELARLGGKEELAKLLLKEELINLAFPDASPEDIAGLYHQVLLEAALPSVPTVPLNPQDDEEWRQYREAYDATLQKLAVLARGSPQTVTMSSADADLPTETEIARAAGQRLVKLILDKWEPSVLAEMISPTEITLEGPSTTDNGFFESLLGTVTDVFERLLGTMTDAFERLFERVTPKSQVVELSEELVGQLENVTEKLSLIAARSEAETLERNNSLRDEDTTVLSDLVVLAQEFPGYELRYEAIRDRLDKLRYAGMLGARAPVMQSTTLESCSGTDETGCCRYWKCRRYGPLRIGAIVWRASA